MTIPYDFFNPVSIRGWIGPDLTPAFSSPPILATWLDFKNNIKNYYATIADFKASAVKIGSYWSIGFNFWGSGTMTMMYQGNSFVFPPAIYQQNLYNPPYVYPVAYNAGNSNALISILRQDFMTDYIEFSQGDWKHPELIWFWEPSLGTPYFSGATIDDSLTATLNDNFLAFGNNPGSGANETFISYGNLFDVCLSTRVIDLDGLADWIYDISPTSSIPVFGMSYPPSNPGSTDILIPQHTIPPLKRRIPFQNYTQPVPRFIKK